MLVRIIVNKGATWDNVVLGRQYIAYGPTPDHAWFDLHKQLKSMFGPNVTLPPWEVCDVRDIYAVIIDHDWVEVTIDDVCEWLGKGCDRRTVELLYENHLLNLEDEDAELYDWLVSKYGMSV